MIRAKDMHFRYKRSQRLFEGLSIELPTGSIVGLLGRNGEGKSTLMKLFTAQLIPSSGSLSYEGREIAKRELAYLQQVYMLPEDMRPPRLSVREYFDTVSSFYPNYDEAIAQELIEAFEVDWSWSLSKVSLGQRKKCMIALALALRTPLLLLDEPTNGLDIPSKSLFRRVLAKYSGEAQTIIISTHQVRDLEQILDHVLMLDRNEVVCNASIAELSERLVFAPISPENRATALYKEPILAGEYGVWQRQSEEDDAGDFSMEIFFNAMIMSRDLMHQALQAPVASTH